MSTFISIAVLVFVVLILICLLVPIRLRLILNDRRRSVIFNWLIVNVNSNLKEKTFQLNLFNQKIIRRKFKKKTKEKIKKAKKKGQKLNIVDLWHKKDLLYQIIPIFLRFLLNILRTIRWDKLFLKVDVATPDPALTGVLYGGLCAVKSSTDYFIPDARIKLRLNFYNQVPRGSAETVFSVRPLNVVSPVTKMFFAMPKIRIVKTFILKKKEVN